MSTTPRSPRFDEPLFDRRIDRLVEGDLPEEQRRELLLQLDARPDGWRRCALAFLEAQSFRQAFAPLLETAKVEATARPVQTVSKPSRSGVTAKWLLLAASLFGCFVLGGLLKEEPSLPSNPVVHNLPVEPVPVIAKSEPERSEPLDAVVQSWQQRGYFVERQNRSVTMKLQDGRKVDVPMQEVRLRNVGNRTY